MSNSKKWLELGLIAHLNKEQEIQTEETKPRKRILGFPGWQIVGRQVHEEIHKQGELAVVSTPVLGLGVAGVVGAAGAGLPGDSPPSFLQTGEWGCLYKFMSCF